MSDSQEANCWGAGVDWRRKPSARFGHAGASSLLLGWPGSFRAGCQAHVWHAPHTSHTWGALSLPLSPSPSPSGSRLGWIGDLCVDQLHPTQYTRPLCLYCCIAHCVQVCWGSWGNFLRSFEKKVGVRILKRWGALHAHHTHVSFYTGCCAQRAQLYVEGGELFKSRGGSRESRVLAGGGL